MDWHRQDLQHQRADPRLGRYRHGHEYRVQDQSRERYPDTAASSVNVARVLPAWGLRL